MNGTFPRFIYLSAVLHLIGFGLLFYGLQKRDVRTFPMIYSVRIIEQSPAVNDPLEAVGRNKNHQDISDGKERIAVPLYERRTAEVPPASSLETPLPEDDSSVLDDASRSEPLLSEKSKVPSPDDKAGDGQSQPLDGSKRLFDRDILRMIAQAEKKPPEKEGITFDTKEYKYKRYMQRLKETIEGIWIYPRSAAEKGIYGDLFVRFIIRKDGTLSEVKVIRTSGHRELDSAAIRALRDAEPFWPLPENWGISTLTVTGHFIYTIYGMEVR